MDRSEEGTEEDAHGNNQVDDRGVAHRQFHFVNFLEETGKDKVGRNGQ